MSKKPGDEEPKTTLQIGPDADAVKPPKPPNPPTTIPSTPRMPIQQFRTCDIIVDITPGTLALLLPVLLLPQIYASLIARYNVILASVILLLAGRSSTPSPEGSPEPSPE